MLEIREALNRWLEIDYHYMANRLGFINVECKASHSLILDSIRALDRETTCSASPDTNVIITLVALMWEHTDKSKYQLNDIIRKILSRIGYPTSAIITDDNYDYSCSQFSSTRSIIDRYTMTLLQSPFDVQIGKKRFLFTCFQKQLWDKLNQKRIVGVSAPTSAGKSYVVLLYTINKMLNSSHNIIYIVPTLSLLNQVTEDYGKMIKMIGLSDVVVTNNLDIGDSESPHSVFIWTQEKAIANLSGFVEKKMPIETILVVDEIQNIERVSEDDDIRAKILYDTLQELRHYSNISQIIISGPRINKIDHLGKDLFGEKTAEVTSCVSPVLSLTYSIMKNGKKYYMKQYCSVKDKPFEKPIDNPDIISGYGQSSLSSEYLEYLGELIKKLKDDQNIVFAPTSSAARKMAISISEKFVSTSSDSIADLIDYYRKTVNPHYSLCETLKNGIAYHHGKLPIHVRRTIEKAIKARYISTIVCTTTLVQGMNLPAQNIVIRNPHLYTRHHSGAAELTNYEMANLRGRAGRLLKDFVGRTIVLDESEFESAEGYDQVTLFEDTTKEITPGYAEKFIEYQDEVLDAVESGKHVSNEMQGYGYLVTYIRQTVMKYGSSSQKRLAETGINLTPKQVAAIILKLKDLSVPKSICTNNRYWDPVVLDDIFKKFKGAIPINPTERGAENKLSNLLLFLRENHSTSDMYSRYIPSQYQKGRGRGILCSICIKWSSETPLSEILSGQYYEGENGAENIEKMIKLLQETVSFNVPMLIKPLIEIDGGNSTFISCLQTGSYKKATKKMIEIGVPRELAIKIECSISSEEYEKIEGAYAQEIYIRDKLQQIKNELPYWEKVQLDFIEGEE